MQKYELTVILDGKATLAKKKSVSGKVEKLIQVSGGKVVKTDDWGVKDLAYPLGKSTTGLPLLFHLELDTEAVKSLPAKLKMESEIVRYLLVREK